MLTEPASNDFRHPEDTRGPSIRDYIREGWKDLEVDWNLYGKEWWHDTRNVARNVYRGTGRAVKSSYRSIQNEWSSEMQVLKADLQVQKSLMQQDFQDLVQASRQWKDQVLSRRRQHQDTEPRQPPEPSRNQQQGTTTGVAKETFMREILAFQAKLNDPSFVGELNRLILSKMISCKDLVAYYRERPDLKEYTLTKELHRMNYTVFTENGKKWTEPEDIQRYAAQQELQQLPRNLDHEILWRASNQSILGDIITTLTCDDGLVRPQYHAATFVTDIDLTLDLGRSTPHLTAECFVNLTIPGYEGERLKLAGILVGVYFCPAANKMEARVLHISPSDPLSLEELEGAAKALAGE